MATIFMMTILITIDIAVKKINFIYIIKQNYNYSYSSNYTFYNSWLTKYTNMAAVVMHFSM